MSVIEVLKEIKKHISCHTDLHGFDLPEPADYYPIFDKELNNALDEALLALEQKDVCSDCGGRGKHVLCRKCMQGIINKCRKQGANDKAIKELKVLGGFAETITSMGGDTDYPQLLDYIEKRIKELERGKTL